jgi:hypothetical protein
MGMIRRQCGRTAGHTHRIFGARWLKGSYGKAEMQPDQIFRACGGKGLRRSES